MPKPPLGGGGGGGVTETGGGGATSLTGRTQLGAWAAAVAAAPVVAAVAHRASAEACDPNALRATIGLIGCAEE